MTKPANTARAQRTNTGASAALAGYDYQLDVSIFAALRILFVTKSASRITIEPANADDIEVELEEDDPGHVEAMAQLGVATRIIMQVKLRRGDPWSIDAKPSTLPSVVRVEVGDATAGWPGEVKHLAIWSGALPSLPAPYLS